MKKYEFFDHTADMGLRISGSSLAELFENAGLLKKDLGWISRIVLSHGRYDHTGGLKQVLQLTGPVDVYAPPFLPSVSPQ